jgi:hypothetical protein
MRKSDGDVARPFDSRESREFCSRINWTHWLSLQLWSDLPANGGCIHLSGAALNEWRVQILSKFSEKILIEQINICGRSGLIFQSNCGSHG